MNEIQHINLDVKNNKTYDYIYTKQYDVGRQVIFHVTKDGEPWEGTQTTRAIFELLKPDGYCIIEDLEYDYSSNTVTLTLDEQITVLSGRLPYQITLKDGDQIISTVTGRILCDKSVVQRDEIKSESSGNLIEDLIDLYDNNPFAIQVTTLPANGWDNKQQTITIQGVTSNETNQLIIVRPTNDYIEAYINSGIMCIAQGENELTFKCTATPLTDIDINVVTQGMNSRYGNIAWSWSDVPLGRYDQNEHDVLVQDYGYSYIETIDETDPWVERPSVVVDDEVGDLILTNDTTWDGTHSSLKDTIAAIMQSNSFLVPITASDYENLSQAEKDDTSKLYLVREDEEVLP